VIADIEWKRQFDTLGPQGVRSALLANRWDGEIRAAAREWLERADASAWQATRKAGESSTEERKSTMDVFRRYRWVYYVAGGAFGLLALTQIFKF
jgi:hypothetical protein